MPLTNVNLNRIDGSVGSISTASINNIKNPNSASNNVVLNSDGTTTLTPSNIIKSETAKPTTSGTAIDFTGIPSWVKRITVMFNGVSTNGSSVLLIQLGSGSVATTDYVSTATSTSSGGTVVATSTAGMVVSGNNASAFAQVGSVIITNVNSNSWVAFGSGLQSTAQTSCLGGAITLSGTLARIRLTTVNGTDTFDAGSVNILYEG